MKTGKIAAKRRDMVPVCFMANGEERRRYAPSPISERVQPGSREAENPGVFNGFRTIYKNSHPTWMTVLYHERLPFNI